MQTARDSTLQNLGMIVSLIIAGIFTLKACDVRQHYEQASIAERVAALPVLDIEVVMQGHNDPFTVALGSYIVGFCLYALGVAWVLFVILPNLYRRIFESKSRSDLI